MVLRRGIDFSRHQGLPDLDRTAREAGLDFWIARACTGAGVFDSQFARSWRIMRQYSGLIRLGAYAYIVTEISARAHFEGIMRVMNGYFGDEPFIIDCEPREDEIERIATGWPFPKAAYTSMVQELLRLLKAEIEVGVEVYTSAHFWKMITTEPTWLAGELIDVAHYGAVTPSMPRHTTEWEKWQHSSTGRVAGFGNLNVDLQWGKQEGDTTNDLISLEASDAKFHADRILEIL